MIDMFKLIALGFINAEPSGRSLKWLTVVRSFVRALFAVKFEP